MPNSVDAADLRTLPSANGSGSALFLGELSERKGFDLVLDAAPALLERQGELTVAGTGELATRLARASAADPRIRWLGFVDQAERRAAIEGAAVVLLPSRRDPWPLVSAEAIVAGRPVVLGPGVGSVPDLAPLGDFVGVMKHAAAEELARVATSVVGVKVSDEARSRFTPEQSAAAFVAAARMPK
jgi:glycosyltransferase involved in cell wall biosynthesis